MFISSAESAYKEVENKTLFCLNKLHDPPSSNLRNCPSPTEHLAVSFNSRGGAEANSNSLSSDSGLHTEKTSEMSSDDFDPKLDENSPTESGAVADKPAGRESPDTAIKPVVRSASEVMPRSRGVNVKDRIGKFLENKEPNISPTTSVRPAPKKCKNYLNYLIL